MTERERVLILADRPEAYWPGSATLTIQQRLPMAIAAGDASLEVTVYSPYRRRSVVRWLFGPQQADASSGVRYLQGGLIPFLFHLLFHRYGVLHCLVIRSYMFWPVLAARIRRIPVAVTLHDTLFLQRQEPKLTAFVKRSLFTHAQKLLTLGAADERRVDERRGTGIAVRVRNGIDPVGAPVSMNKNRQIIFGGGIGNEHAGLAFLERSLAGLSDPPELRIFGTNAAGIPHARYEGMVERAHFHAAMLTARATVVPSRYESFSMTALESLAMGIPVIISDGCGIARYLTHETDCLIVRYDDTEGMRKALQRILADDGLWERLSLHGQRTASRFLWSSVAVDHITAYRTMLGRGR